MTAGRLRVLALALTLLAMAACDRAGRSATGLDTSERAARAHRLRADAEQAYAEARYPDCARIYVELAALDTPDVDDDELSAAACLASVGDLDGASGHLRAATDRGYRDVAQLATLEDLAPLRERADWPALVDRTTANRERFLAGADRELYALYAADQADRTGARYEDIDWSTVSGRDDERRARVLELMSVAAPRVAADYLHAAMVLQHGDGPDDYQRAHEWALEAVRLAPSDRRVRWMAVATKDRYLMSTGQPQWYGTQFRKVDGRWTLYDVDPTITDQERLKWNAPPLDVAQRRATELNAP